MQGPMNAVYEMRVRVRPGSGCGMPPDVIGGEAMCLVGAPDHVAAVRLAAGELTSRGFIPEGLVGETIWQLDPSLWDGHVPEICSLLEAGYGETAASIRERLPDAAGIRRLAIDGGFVLGPFYCWDTEPPRAPTGEPQHRPGPDLSEAQIRRHNELYDTGYRLIEDLVFAPGPPVQPPRSPGRKRLRRAVRAFERVLEINPSNWQAMLLMGEAQQGLGEREGSLSAFLRAHASAPEEVTVAVEAGATAGRLGRHDVAIRVMEAVARSHPEDPRLPCNLGLSHLFLGETASARVAFKRAIELKPQRAENRRLLALVDDVAAGRRPCPRNEADVVRALS